MTNAETTTLHIAPADFWAIAAAGALVLLTVLAYAALSGVQKSYRPPAWEDLSPRWRLLVLVFGFLWVPLFALTVWAAYAGVWGMIHQGDSGGPGAMPGLGVGALLAALLGAPFVIWGTALKHRTVTFQKEGHITDRISRAVEQLGAEKTVKLPVTDGNGNRITVEETRPNIEVRVGAILSLERIAQDSTAYDKGRDHVRVMEILCAYVRENSKARAVVEHEYGEWTPLKDDPTDAERAEHETRRKERFGTAGRERKVWLWAHGLPEMSLREDVALALQVLCRRSPAQRLVEARHGPDAPTDAPWVFDEPAPKKPERDENDRIAPDDLAAYLTRLEEWKSRIDDYRGYRPDLRKANLQGADLPEIDLRGFDLRGARMEGADLVWARMAGTSLYAADFRGASAREVDWRTVGLSDEQILSLFGDASVQLQGGVAPGDPSWPPHWPVWELDPFDFLPECRAWRADPEGYRPPPPPDDGE